jgi:hypothetical protein
MNEIYWQCLFTPPSLSLSLSPLWCFLASSFSLHPSHPHSHTRCTTHSALVLMELGICTVYFEFISTNIAAVLHDSTVEQRRTIMMCACFLSPY